jgi:hypothetical protein
MIRSFAVAGGLAAVLGASLGRPAAQQPQLPRACLHGPAEQPSQRARREEAVRLAQTINRAEASGPAIIPGQRRTYRALDQLSNLPRTPSGFKLQLNADGTSYTLSLRDTLDACHFTIFSDQELWVYEATPRSGVELLPVETR